MKNLPLITFNSTNRNKPIVLEYEPNSGQIVPHQLLPPNNFWRHFFEQKSNDFSKTNMKNKKEREIIDSLQTIASDSNEQANQVPSYIDAFPKCLEQYVGTNNSNCVLITILNTACKRLQGTCRAFAKISKSIE